MVILRRTAPEEVPMPIVVHGEPPPPVVHIAVIPTRAAPAFAIGWRLRGIAAVAVG